MTIPTNAKPIILRDYEAQALASGRLGAIVRVVKPRYRADECGFQICTNISTSERWIEKYDENECGFDSPRYALPPYRPGDTLWGRETWATCDSFADVFEEPLALGFYYKADAVADGMDWADDKEVVKWRPPHNHATRSLPPHPAG